MKDSLAQKLPKELEKILLKFQGNEITEHFVYKKLAKKATGENKAVLEQIAADELRHYNEWKQFTGKEVKPKKFIVFLYSFISKIFGLTFTVKMLEENEKGAEEEYRKIRNTIPEAEEILKDELQHEYQLIHMINEEKLEYIGSMVLGLNDALVELTGALAGLTFALQNTHMIAIVGLITGIAAALSMAASEYLSTKSEGLKNPLKAAFYTGVAYIVTVVLLVLPFFILSSYYIALMLTLAAALSVIFLFTFFVSVVKELSFGKTFLEMALISLGVAFLSFLVGILVRKVFNIEV